MAQTHEPTPSPPSLTQLLEQPALRITDGRQPAVRRGQSLMSVDSSIDGNVPDDEGRQAASVRKRSRQAGSDNEDENGNGNDDDEFQAPGRSNSGTSDRSFFPAALAHPPRTNTPAAASPQEPTDAADSPDAPPSAQCPICLESWGTTGAHRLVALKCGHLYGQRCIRRWLRQTTRARCPECQAPAAARDLRAIYARQLTACDSQETDRLAKRSAELAATVAELRGELAVAQHRYMAMRGEVKRAREEHARAFERAQWLEAENRALRSARGEEAREVGDLSNLGDLELPDDPDPPDDLTPPLVRARATVRLPPGDTRALALDPHNPTAYITSGRTVHRVSLLTASTFTLPPLHASEIRAASVSPHTPGTRYLLTASSDRTAALTLLACGTAHDPGALVACDPRVALRVPVGAPAWSCAWDAVSPDVFHVGAGMGRLLTFDVRNPKTPVCARVAPQTLARWADGSPAAPPNMSPVHSVVSMPGFLVVANAQHVYRVPQDDPELPWTQITAQVGGRTCLAVSADGSRLAASFRVFAGATQSTAHQVFDMHAEQPPGTQGMWPCALHVPVQSPQTRLARSRLWGFARREGGRRHVVLAAPVEANRCVRLWDAAASASAASASASAASVAPRVVADLQMEGDDPVVDVAAGQWPAVVDDGRQGLAVLAALTTTTLRLYDVR